jgi:hypothetical protein
MQGADRGLRPAHRRIAVEARGLLQERGRLRREIEGLEGARARLEGAVNALTGERNTLTGRVNELTGAVNQLTGQINALTADNNHLTGRVNTLTGRINTLTGDNSRLSAELLDQAEIFRSTHAADADAPPGVGRSLILNAMPASGGDHIADALAGRLNYRLTTLSHGYFPNDMIDFHRIKALRRGGYIAHQHCDAAPVNRHLLALFTDRLIVHVRDPRQALIAWTHHLNRLHEAGSDDLHWVFPPPPESYFTLPPAARLDWQIAHFYPSLTGWLAGWLAVAQEGALAVKFTRHEDFVADQAALLNDIAVFHDIAPADIAPPGERGAYAGEGDDWRCVLSRAQRARLAALTDPALLAAFGWPVE